MKKVILTIGIVFFSSILFSQQDIVLTGRVINSYTKQKVDFATVIVLELRKKTRIDENGVYNINIAQPGTYTIYVKSLGLKTYKTRINISRSMTRDFFLSPLTIRGRTHVIRGRRTIQKVSRRTMNADQIKSVPGSFGDSLNALTSLPGVIRTFGGMFGPLIIRGMNQNYNRYYIDGMPINEPMHFGGFHSVIANDLMREIDLYASAFPSRYGSPMAAVIEINTIDKVKEFGGYIDLNLISGSLLFKVPIFRNVIVGEEIKKETAGYIIVSSRVGYLSLIIPVIYRIITGEELESVPEYWDYQLKAKYYFNSHHSLTVLCLGSVDYFKFLVKERFIDIDEGQDPLFANFEFETDQQFHNQGLYYTYQRDKLKSVLLAYSSITMYYNYFNSRQVSTVDWLKDIHVDSRPNIFGLKENVNFEWWEKHGELRGGLEFTLYNFTTRGRTLHVNEKIISFDITNPDLFLVAPVDLNFNNYAMGGYIDNRFTFGGLTVVPGIRFDYLFGANLITYDPRIMISYEFISETTISVAGGHYSTFLQTNPYLFKFNPDFASYKDEIKPEHACH
ncbi:carboxypeptidase-like regulatory domain-containing protein, partial [Spirochaetota bacterium]